MLHRPSRDGPVARRVKLRLPLELPQAAFRFRPIHTLAKLDVPENVLALVGCGIELVVGEVFPLRQETRLELDPVVTPEMIVHGHSLEADMIASIRRVQRSSVARADAEPACQPVAPDGAAGLAMVL
jgi:hypothetical protein